MLPVLDLCCEGDDRVIVVAAENLAGVQVNLANQARGIIIDDRV